jgi:hypothetical protein
MPYPRQCPAPCRDGAGRQERMTVVARYPDSTKTSLEQRLRARARERWPQIASLQIRHRGDFSYVDATLTDATTLKLCRLRYVGSASQWQFAIYRASHDDYDESVFFTGLPVGTCQDALDTACGLYLNDPTAWIRPPTNLRARPLSPGDLHALAGAHPDQVGLEFGDHREDIEQQPPDWVVRVIERPADVQLHPGAGEFAGDVAGVGEGAGEPVEFGDHEGVPGPAGGQRLAQPDRDRLVPVRPWST